MATKGGSLNLCIWVIASGWDQLMDQHVTFEKYLVQDALFEHDVDEKIYKNNYGQH